MSFNHPTHNNHPPPPPVPPPFASPPYPHTVPPSPHNSYFFSQQQAFLGGVMRPPHWRPETPVNPEYFTNPMQFQGAMQHTYMVQREMEKQRIRAEIIREEIIRRRILEDEVRRELMTEREMGLKFAIPGPTPVRIEPLMPLLTNVEEGEKSSGLSVPPQQAVVLGSSGSLPFQRDPELTGNVNRNPSSISLPEIKDTQLSKDKIIILAKPSSDLSELKRKATAEPDGAGSEPASGGVKKQKTKDDWSCALCHVTATNEKGLNEHLNGRRHKARERAMVQKTGFGTDPLPRKNRIQIRRSSKVHVVTNAPIFMKKGEKAIDAPAPGGSVQRCSGTTPLQSNNSTSTIQPIKVSVVTMAPSSVKKDEKVDEAPAATGMVENFGTTPFPTMNKTSMSKPIAVPAVTDSLGSVQTNEKAQETLENNSKTGLEFIFPCLAHRSPIAEAVPAPTIMVDNSCFGTSPLPTMKKTSTSEPIEVPVVTNTLSSVQTNEKAQETLAPIAEGASLQENGKCEEKVCGKETNPKSKGKFRFYCELCSVGAYNQRVMDAHMGGKKHLANVAKATEANKTGENTPAKATEANNVAACADNESDNAAADTKRRRYTTRSQGKIKQVLTNGNNVSKTEHKNKIPESVLPQ